MRNWKAAFTVHGNKKKRRSLHTQQLSASTAASVARWPQGRQTKFIRLVEFTIRFQHARARMNLITRSIRHAKYNRFINGTNYDKMALYTKKNITRITHMLINVLRPNWPVQRACTSRRFVCYIKRLFQFATRIIDTRNSPVLGRNKNYIYIL